MDTILFHACYRESELTKMKGKKNQARNHALRVQIYCFVLKAKQPQD